MKTRSITSVTYILIGNMLTTYGLIGSGWTATLTSLFGLVLFFIGLGRLKEALDATGQDGVSKLVWAAILGIIANVLSYIPLAGGIIAGLINLLAYILQLIGLTKLKKSKVLGETGATGVNYLLIAMVILVFGSLFKILPFVGGTITSVISFIAFIIIPFGWLKIQEALIVNVTIPNAINAPSSDINNAQPDADHMSSVLNDDNDSYAYCTVCGSKIENEKASFCTNCGANI